MQTQLNNAFAGLNARMIDNDQEWAANKLDTLSRFLDQARADFAEGRNNYTSGYGRFCNATATGLYGPVDIGRAAVLCISGYIALCVAVYAVVYAFRPSQNDD